MLLAFRDEWIQDFAGSLRQLVLFDGRFCVAENVGKGWQADFDLLECFRQIIVVVILQSFTDSDADIDELNDGRRSTKSLETRHFIANVSRRLA